MIENVIFSEYVDLEYSNNENVIKYVVSNNYTFSISEIKLEDTDIIRRLKYNQNKCQRVSCVAVKNKWNSEEFTKTKVRNKFTFIKEYYVNFYYDDLFNWDFVYDHFLVNINPIIKNKLSDMPVINMQNSYDNSKIVYNKSVGLSEYLRDDVPTKMFIEFTKIDKKKVNSKVDKVTKYIQKLLVLGDLHVTVIARDRKETCDIRIIYDNLVLPNLWYCNEIVNYLAHFKNIRDDIYKNGTVLDQYGTLKKSMCIEVLRNDKNNKRILVQPEFSIKDITLLRDVYNNVLYNVQNNAIDIFKVRKLGILETETIDNNFTKCELLKECEVCKSNHKDGFILRYDINEYLYCPYYGLNRLVTLPHSNNLVDGSDFRVTVPSTNINIINENSKYINDDKYNDKRNIKEVTKLRYATTLLTKLSNLKGIKKDSGIVAYNRLYNYDKYENISLIKLHDAFAYLYSVFKIDDKEFKKLFYGGSKIPTVLPSEYNFKQYNGLLKSMLKDTYHMSVILNKPNARKGAVSLNLVVN